MKALLYSFLLASVLLTACGKDSGGGGGTTPTEENLVVTTSPVNGAVEAPAPGPDFPLTVTVNSKMPASGVKIEVSAKPEAGGAAFFSEQKSNTNASNSFTITGTPATVISIVEVKVTSLSKPANIWTGSYRYSRK